MDAFAHLDSLLRRIAETDITVAAVCSRAGIQHSLVSKWRKRKHEPRASSLTSMEKAFDEPVKESLL